MVLVFTAQEIYSFSQTHWLVNSQERFWLKAATTQSFDKLKVSVLSRDTLLWTSQAQTSRSCCTSWVLRRERKTRKKRRNTRRKERGKSRLCCQKKCFILLTAVIFLLCCNFYCTKNSVLHSSQLIAIDSDQLIDICNCTWYLTIEKYHQQLWLNKQVIAIVFGQLNIASFHSFVRFIVVELNWITYIW